MAAGPIGVSTVGAVAAGAVLTRVRGRVYATLIAKRTFELRAGGDMVAVMAEPLVARERYNGGSLVQSVRVTSELAPYLPAADVLFTGHVHAPGGAARVVDVRLAVWGERVLMDKALRVGSADPFDKLPLVYERAYGGPGMADNPVGTTTPNIVNPRLPDTPVGFGPISASWPARRRLKKLVETAPIQDIPDDIDWTYFLASPPDQRVSYLAGNEWVFLENLLPGGGPFQSRLPDARAFARIRWSRDGEASAPSSLHADTLRIDGDAGRCALICRGVFPLPDGAQIEELRAAVAFSLGGAPIDWTQATLRGRADDLSSTLARTPKEPGGDPLSVGGTLQIDQRPSIGGTLPFHSASVGHGRAANIPAPPRSSAVPLPGAPWSGVQVKPGRARVSHLDQTIADEDLGRVVSSVASAAGGAPVPEVALERAAPTSFPPEPPAPERPAPEPRAAEPTSTDRDPWAKEPPPAPAAPPRPAPLPQGPAAVTTFVRKSGYDRFKR